MKPNQPESSRDRNFEEEANRVREHFLSKGARFVRWNSRNGQLDFSTVSFDNFCFRIESDFGLAQIIEALQKGQIFKTED